MCFGEPDHRGRELDAAHGWCRDARERSWRPSGGRAWPCALASPAGARSPASCCARRPWRPDLGRSAGCGIRRARPSGAVCSGVSRASSRRVKALVSEQRSSSTVAVHPHAGPGARVRDTLKAPRATAWVSGGRRVAARWRATSSSVAMRLAPRSPSQVARRCRCHSSSFSSVVSVARRSRNRRDGARESASTASTAEAERVERVGRRDTRSRSRRSLPPTLAAWRRSGFAILAEQRDGGRARVQVLERFRRCSSAGAPGRRHRGPESVSRRVREAVVSGAARAKTDESQGGCNRLSPARDPQRRTERGPATSATRSRKRELAVRARPRCAAVARRIHRERIEAAQDRGSCARCRGSRIALEAAASRDRSSPLLRARSSLTTSATPERAALESRGAAVRIELRWRVRRR